MRNTCLIFLKAAVAVSMLLLLTFASVSCGKVLAEVDEELPEITPLPQPEIPEEPADEYDEEAILNHVKSDFSWWEELRPRKRQELSFERGTMCVKLCSDSKYIYGYVAVDTTKVLSRTGKNSPEYLNYLGIWLDTDDVHEGQGGGWFMSASPKGYDRLLRGKCSETADPLDWKPGVYDVRSGGDSFGVTDEEAGGWRNTGVGTGKVEDDIFRYTFTIDRIRLGIGEKTEVHLGISFDAGGYLDYTVIPDRAGYLLKLGTTDEIEYDLDGTEEPKSLDINDMLKDFSFWEGVGEMDRGTDTQFERGTRCVKFSSDTDYLYGYVEVDATKVLDRSGVNRPEYLNHLGIWLDTDDVHEGQGGGWALSQSPKGYDILLYGSCAVNAVPKAWIVEVRDVSAKADSFGKPYPDAAGWENYAAGEGKADGDLFLYTFVLDRKTLGIDVLDEVNLALTFNQNNAAYNDFMVVPARCGFNVPLAR